MSFVEHLRVAAGTTHSVAIRPGNSLINYLMFLKITHFTTSSLTQFLFIWKNFHNKSYMVNNKVKYNNEFRYNIFKKNAVIVFRTIHRTPYVKINISTLSQSRGVLSHIQANENERMSRQEFGHKNFISDLIVLEQFISHKRKQNKDQWC